ncbi:MAG: carboxylating nicotinate-nucleotide diphosphorylase [Nocardioides sp.]|nr:carboxylating nicotinate-nucleotide diphosphorylase [Nocardioides sp.]
MSHVTEIAALPFVSLPDELVTELDATGLGAHQVYDAVVRALAEDLPGDDVTSWSTIPADDTATANLVTRRPGTVAGLGVAEVVFRHVIGEAVEVSRIAGDGDVVRPGDTVLRVTGPTALLLTAERTALNFIGHLSGVATATAAWVAALDGTGARVRDTRKTIPGHRAMEKYAVRCGGGVNHRHSLSDMALVKDNHVVAAGGVVAAWKLIRDRHPDVPVQVEVDNLDQVRELLDAGVEHILLDNMDPAGLTEAVAITDGRAELEASGGLTLEVAAEIASTGVDYIAVGALTHSAMVLDIGMDLRS